ncbi:hypothetical protein [uncultured Nitrosomonas sp.]|uniref:hypothetical protein n=1 Tax=uncultured Nitrosomonas sp. TaxID=156424 RepID=UPI0025E45261|nr:hypothetical protein [uncultured Nitrosomonas sp.]
MKSPETSINTNLLMLAALFGGFINSAFDPFLYALSQIQVPYRISPMHGEILILAKNQSRCQPCNNLGHA